MLAAAKVKISGSEKKKSEQEYMRHLIHKTCSLEVSRRSLSKQRQRNVQKSVLHVQSILYFY